MGMMALGVGKSCLELPPPCAPSELSQTLQCCGAGAAMEAVLPLGYIFPSPEGRVQDWGGIAGVHGSPRGGSPSTSPTGCEPRFGAELLCAHLSWPSSRAFPLSELGLGFIPQLLLLEPMLLEWKSALVCQPSPELSSAYTAQPWLSTVPTGTQIHAGSSSWEPAEGRHWDSTRILLYPLPPCPSWYADPARTTSHFPLGYGAFSLFPSTTTPPSCAHLGPKSLVCSQRPPASPTACMRRAWQCPR